MVNDESVFIPEEVQGCTTRKVSWLRGTLARLCAVPFQRLFPNWQEQLKKELAGYDSVLDLGCGYNSAIRYCHVPFSVGVDHYEPYLNWSESKGYHNEYIKSDIRSLELTPKSFDAVVMFTVIEHMPKEDGLAMIKKAELWARKKVIITTPNKYQRQEVIDDNPLQEHKCGWSAKELRDLGFKVYGKFGWKPLRGLCAVKYKPAILWEAISGVTQYVTQFVPELATMLFAIKLTGDGKGEDFAEDGT